MKIPEFELQKQGRPATRLTYNQSNGGSIATILTSYGTTNPTANYTASTKPIILVDAVHQPVVITLPQASGAFGKFYTIKKVDNSNNLVTIKGYTTTETIDGEISITMSLQYQYITIVCDGYDWYIIGGEYVKLEDILEEKLDKISDTLNKLLLVTEQENIHLASISGEDLEEV